MYKYKVKNIKIELQSEKKEILHNLAEQNIKDNKSTKDSPKSLNKSLIPLGSFTCRTKKWIKHDKAEREHTAD